MRAVSQHPISTSAGGRSRRWPLISRPRPVYRRAAQDAFSDPNAYPFDSRGLIFTFAFFTPKHLGEGQFYLMTVKDKDGQNYSGSKNYRLTVPADAPAKQQRSA